MENRKSTKQQYKQNHKDDIMNYNKDYYEEHKTEFLRKSKEDRKTNPEKYKKIDQQKNYVRNKDTTTSADPSNKMHLDSYLLPHHAGRLHYGPPLPTTVSPAITTSAWTLPQPKPTKPYPSGQHQLRRHSYSHFRSDRFRSTARSKSSACYTSGKFGHFGRKCRSTSATRSHSGNSRPPFQSPYSPQSRSTSPTPFLQIPYQDPQRRSSSPSPQLLAGERCQKCHRLSHTLQRCTYPSPLPQCSMCLKFGHHRSQKMNLRGELR